jgi:hypothetical protein
MFPAVKRRALLGCACHPEVHAVTGANTHFMIQSTPLKLLLLCTREEHTKPSLQVMLIHLISATSHSTDMGGFNSIIYDNHCLDFSFECLENNTHNKELMEFLCSKLLPK